MDIEPARQGRKLPVKIRLDHLLVQRGLAASRSKAQDLIRRGAVRVKGQAILKTGFETAQNEAIEVSGEEYYVARSAWKLIAALDAFGFSPEGCACLDVGASAGGFTQVLLERGASQVFAVDVGHGQLHASLRENPRVVSLEATDARVIPPGKLTAPITAVTCDVSFISLLKVLPAILPLTQADAWLAALVKPQFEVGRAFVGKGGIVKDEGAKQEAVRRVALAIETLGWRICGTLHSPLPGQDGNKEILIGAIRAAG